MMPAARKWKRQQPLDSLILDPYTVVKRAKNGQLYAIPYHLEFREKILPIANLLKVAAEISDSKEFARRLNFQAGALLDGTYEASDIYWLSMKPYKIDVVIGPIERYEDKLLFRKTAYQAWVGVTDERLTRKLNYLKEAMLTGTRKVVQASNQVSPSKIQLRVNQTLFFQV